MSLLLQVNLHEDTVWLNASTATIGWAIASAQGFGFTWPQWAQKSEKDWRDEIAPLPMCNYHAGLKLGVCPHGSPTKPVHLREEVCRHMAAHFLKEVHGLSW